MNSIRKSLFLFLCLNLLFKYSLSIPSTPSNMTGRDDLLYKSSNRVLSQEFHPPLFVHKSSHTIGIKKVPFDTLKKNFVAAKNNFLICHCVCFI